MKMYEYVNVKIGKLIGAKSEEHRAIIDEYASKGYRQKFETMEQSNRWTWFLRKMNNCSDFGGTNVHKCN